MPPFRTRPYIKIWADEWPDAYRMGRQDYYDVGVWVQLMLELTKTAQPGHFVDADGKAMSEEEIAGLVGGKPVESVRRLVERRVLHRGKGGVLYSPEMIAEFRRRWAARVKIGRGRGGLVGMPSEVMVQVRRMVGAGLKIKEAQYLALRRMHHGVDWGAVVDDAIAAQYRGEVENVCGWIAERAEKGKVADGAKGGTHGEAAEGKGCAERTRGGEAGVGDAGGIVAGDVQSDVGSDGV